MNELASDLFGTWVASWQAFSQTVRASASWERTAKGQQIFDGYSPVMTSQAQCVPVSAPWLMAYPVVFELVPSGDRAFIRTDCMGTERTVYLDGRAHPPKQERFQQGHSTGHWEDDVLVVDTVNFADQIFGGNASGAQKHLVERYSLSAAPAAGPTRGGADLDREGGSLR